MVNFTYATEFVLLGFRGGPGTQTALFLVFLILYVAAVVGNLGLTVLIGAYAHLHTPMYALLRSLSVLDLCYSSTIAPRALIDCLRRDRAVSLAGCAAQFFFLSLFGTTEAFLLAAMAYDRFVAICSPLLYPVRMSPRVCARLVSGSYFGGAVNAVTQTAMTFSLSFCGSLEIDDFFCDVPPLLSLSCSDTALNQLVLLVLCSAVIVGALLAISASYACILAAVLRVRSAQGRGKAFSTCAAHLAAVSLFFGTAFFMYAQPAAAMEQGKVASVFYTVVIPTLNPLIYSLRNRDVQRALRSSRQKLALIGGGWGPPGPGPRPRAEAGADGRLLRLPVLGSGSGLRGARWAPTQRLSTPGPLGLLVCELEDSV
ncbi:olfactory receptor 12 [Tupaia chinensis]|uniref:Olfactory receptor n=1 Tax=Tupaia chinensis TaxID=246437 RepID=L9KMN0_TUPCH|nr:olfactory receptor 12 [Tupaia chinensis]ELW62407.1 Olfactory receptor 12 [Tupaia chinensis]